MNSGPSRTSQAVALSRAELDRPHSPNGDPGAQRALCAGLDFVPPAWLRPGIEAPDYPNRIPAVFNYYSIGTAREKTDKQAGPDDSAALPCD